MAASINAVAAICARKPSSAQGQNTSGGRGRPCPSAIITPARKTSANGKPNRKRTWVAPTVPSLAVSSRWVALRTVCAAAAISVNTTHSQPVSLIPHLPCPRFHPPCGRGAQAVLRHGGLPLPAETRHDPVSGRDQTHERFKAHRLRRHGQHGHPHGGQSGARRSPGDGL